MSTIENIIALRVDPETELRQIQPSDAKDIFKTIDSQREYLGRWLPFVETTKEEDDTLNFIKAIVETSKEKQDYVFTIQKNNCFIGLIGFKDTDDINKKTEIGYWLSETEQGKGVISKSVEILCTYAFHELNMNRIQIKCAVGNTPSKRIPQRLGFKFEGIERDGELLTGGEYTDLEIYSKLKKD